MFSVPCGCLVFELWMSWRKRSSHYKALLHQTHPRGRTDLKTQRQQAVQEHNTCPLGLSPALKIHSRYPFSSRSICCCRRSFRKARRFSTRSRSLANSLQHVGRRKASRASECRDHTATGMQSQRPRLQGGPSRHPLLTYVIDTGQHRAALLPGEPDCQPTMILLRLQHSGAEGF